MSETILVKGTGDVTLSENGTASSGAIDEICANS